MPDRFGDARRLGNAFGWATMLMSRRHGELQGVPRPRMGIAPRHIFHFDDDAARRGLARAVTCAAVFYLAISDITPAKACSVPVFRYALERWPVDDYDVFVFHRDGLTPEQQAVVDSLEARASKDGAPCNYRVHVVDLTSELDPYAKHIWQAQTKAKPPWLVVRYPMYSRIAWDVWSGPLSRNVAKRLPDSPARREIAKRLLEGDWAVWVLLTSGKKTKDQAAAKMLRNQLKKLQEMLKLPSPTDPRVLADPDPNANDVTLVDAEGSLRITFSVVRVSRNDPAEAMFVEMLLRTEADLATFDEPMAFPIFGRGRVLFALVGKGVNAETIGQACDFLVGPCFCQVKAQNPGIDLIMSVDWDNSLAESMVADTEFVELTSRSPRGANAVADPNRTTPSTQPAASQEPDVLVRNLLLTLGGIVVLAISLSLAIRRRSPR